MVKVRGDEWVCNIKKLAENAVKHGEDGPDQGTDVVPVWGERKAQAPRQVTQSSLGHGQIGKRVEKRTRKKKIQEMKQSGLSPNVRKNTKGMRKGGLGAITSSRGRGGGKVHVQPNMQSKWRRF